MTIKIFLPNLAIKRKEDDLIKQDLIQILENNSVKVVRATLEGVESGKWFKAELENREDEQRIANEIRKRKLYEKLDINPKVYYTIIIKKIPNDLNEDTLKEKLEKICKCQFDNIKINVKQKKPNYPKKAFIEVTSLAKAEGLITNLNNQVLNDIKLEVEFVEIYSTPKREIKTLDYLDRTTVETDLTSLGAFYEKRDYELVTKKLKEFIYEVCTYLSSLPSHQEVTPVEQEKKNSD